MDPNTFIESGVIERYALGQATCFEAREVEFMAEEHTDVRQAVEEVFGGVEAVARVSAVPLSDEARRQSLSAVMERIGKESGQSGVVRRLDPNAGNGQAGRDPGASAADPGSRIRRMQTWTGIAAALVLLAGAAAFYLNNQNRALEREQVAQQSELDRLGREAGAAKAELDRTQDYLALLRDAATRRVPLMPVGGDDQARVDVYWNPELEQAYFDVLQLADLPSDRQYQLWAIVGGQPQDMGVLPVSGERAPGQDAEAGVPALQEFPFVDAPDAFAITIEPLGGSEAPTLDQMVVLGAMG